MLHGEGHTFASFAQFFGEQRDGLNTGGGVLAHIESNQTCKDSQTNFSTRGRGVVQHFLFRVVHKELTDTDRCCMNDLRNGQDFSVHFVLVIERIVRSGRHSNCMVGSLVRADNGIAAATTMGTRIVVKGGFVGIRKYPLLVIVVEQRHHVVLDRWFLQHLVEVSDGLPVLELNPNYTNGAAVTIRAFCQCCRVRVGDSHLLMSKFRQLYRARLDLNPFIGI